VPANSTASVNFPNDGKQVYADGKKITTQSNYQLQAGSYEFEIK